MRQAVFIIASLIALCSPVLAADPSAIERGRKALLEHCYSPPTIALRAYDEAWKEWGLKGKPSSDEYDRLFRARYGLHPAPYPNGGLPMGLRKVPMAFGLTRGISVDCMICHGGSIMGRSYVGLGNSSLDYQAFHEEMMAASGQSRKPPFQFSNVRGTSEAGGMAVFLLGYREPDLRLRFTRRELDLNDDLCEDVPAWWLLKKKKTMYHTGGADARSVRSLMQFMLSPLNGPSDIKNAEPAFKDIQAYLLSLEPPPYPFPIDRALARIGEELFGTHCARCHGSYGPGGSYPNKIVAIDRIGTDRQRFDGITRKFAEYYARSWFGADYSLRETRGYQAPPLDGIWATAPYLHNGSVPTVYQVLSSRSRPEIFTRSYRTDEADYDSRRLGWKYEVMARGSGGKSAFEQRKVYDTSKSGRGNGGHIYGDHLSDNQRMAIIEYLKTL